MNDLTVICPYCGAIVPTDLEQQPWYQQQNEILNIPMLERVGRLATGEWVSKKKDPRLGGVASVWNNTVGLLRGYKLDVNVMKKEIRCKSETCRAAFDCYVNLDSHHSFAEFWPHLTGKIDEDGHYTSSGATASAEQIINLGNKFHVNPNSFFVLLIIGVYLLSLWPYFSSGLEPVKILDHALLRGTATLLVAMMIWNIKKTSEHIRGSFSAMKDVLMVKNGDSLQFWLNFTLGRVTGVKFPPQSKQAPDQPRKPGLREYFSTFTFSQAAVVGGIPSLLIALLIWLFNYLPHLPGLNLLAISDLFFWFIVVYFTGVAAWIGFNVGVFVLQNISLIPLKLTPLNGFANLAPIRKIATLSLQIVIPVALLPVVFIVALPALPSLHDLSLFWLLPWVRIALGFCLVLIGLADTGILLLGLVYIGLLPILSSSLTGLPNRIWDISLNDWIGLAVLGVFLSILLGYHISRAFVPFSRIAKEKKQETIDQISRQLFTLSDELRDIDLKGPVLTESEKAQRNMVLHNISSALDLRERISSTKVGIINPQTSVEVVSPLITSLLLPVTIEIIKIRIENIFL